MAATNRKGIFSLQDVKLRQGSGNWPTEAFTKPPYNLDWQYGYIAQGYVPTPIASSISRIDFSNDGILQTFRSKTTTPRYDPQGTGSKTHGYISGGATPGVISSTERFSYANDTATTVTAGSDIIQRETGSAVSTADYGYFGGGSPGPLSSVGRLDFSSDTTVMAPKGPLSQARYYPGANGNADYGYFAGGGPGPYSIVDRIDFANDTATASPKGPLSAPESNTGAAGNRNYGWWSGGTSNPTTVYRVDYSNDTATASPRGNLQTSRTNVNSTGNQSFGYFCGGQPVPVQSIVQRIDYSNDTTITSPRGNMTYSASNMVGMSAVENGLPGTPLSIPDQGVGITTTGASVQFDVGKNVFSYPYGYFGGGYPPGPITTVSRIDYSNDTSTASVRGSLSSGRYNFAGMVNNGNFGYFGGGYFPGNYTDIHRLDFSNDTITMPVVSNISYYRRRGSQSSIGNKDYGYFAGGSDNASGRYSTVDRLDFSNDTATAAPKGPLGEGKSNVVTTGNQNFGYAMGGSPAVSTIRRIDFSNDTVTAANRGPLASTRYGAGATGTRDFGYIMGGYLPGVSSTTERIDYSNDTPSSTGNLSRTQGYGAAVGNSVYGYITGTNSNVERLNFLNDTATGLARGQTQLGTASGIFGVSSQNNALAQPLAQINDLKGPLAVATPGQQYGYMAGADPHKTSVFRIDYANDTNEVGFKGNIPESRYALASTSSPYYGYIIAGFNPSGGVSTVDRIDYSNDSVTAGSRGNLNFQVYYGDACGNKDYGYHGNGAEWPAPRYSSRTTRIDYSNDDATSVNKGNLLSLEETSAVSNQDYGYWTGGNASGGPNFQSSNTRLDFSNDTTAGSPKGNLASGRTSHFATGNASYGYFGAGKAPATSSTVQRLDYSNDTATMSPKGPLSAVKYFGSATGNKNYGYFSGGYSPAAKSIVDRVDFANDTATAPTRTFLSETRYNFTATSAAKFGNPQG